MSCADDAIYQQTLKRIGITPFLKEFVSRSAGWGHPLAFDEDVSVDQVGPASASNLSPR